MSQVNHKPLLASIRLRDRIRELEAEGADFGDLTYGKLVPQTGKHRFIDVELRLNQSEEDYKNNKHWWRNNKDKSGAKLVEIIDGIEADLSRRAGTANNGGNGAGGGADA